MYLSGLGESVSFPCFSVFKSTLQSSFWTLPGVCSLVCSLGVIAMPGVAKVSGWEESLSSPSVIRLLLSTASGDGTSKVG